MKLCGIWGRPYLDLSDLVDTRGFAAIDDEISRALPQLDAGYTGGTLKWMGVVAPWQVSDGYRDAMDAIAAMSLAEKRAFAAMNTDAPPLDDDDEPAFGDETDRPFSHEQCLYLKVRHGVYFPWKTCFHLVENDRWEDKHSGDGKSFHEQAERHLPLTVAFVKSLPFSEIGRAVLFGVEANDHAPFHRDSEPGRDPSIAQSISFDPRGTKRLVLRDPAGGSRTEIDAPVYWFNDMDYHGVEPQKFFRYSIRVDGVFEPAFVRALRDRFG